MDPARPDDRTRLAEPLAALSLATDLGLGRPLEHQLGICLSAMDLADRVGSTEEERSEVYYLALLVHVGCTAAAPDFARWVGGDEIHFQAGAQVLGPASEPREDIRHLLGRFADDRPLRRRAGLVVGMAAGGQKRFAAAAANLCEGGALLAEQLHLPDVVGRALGQVTARWDGKGVPAGVAGDEIPRSLRIVRVAHDLVALADVRGRDAAVEALGRRRGRGYDPAIVDGALDAPGALIDAARVPDAWERVLAAEPEPVATISGAGLGMVARAFGAFVDVKVGFLRGHSGRVAALAAEAAEALGCSRVEAGEIRAAGHVHDLGRVSVANGIWEERGELSAAAWERVRLHPYYTERILERSAPLARLAALAGSHHERLDGSGYHRGSAAPQLGVGARVLAAADAFDAMTHERPYRPTLGLDGARRELGDMVRAGALDKRAVDAVLGAAGAVPLKVREGYPAGLTEREVQVLRLLAQGRSNREIAASLVISDKTAGHHVEHIYGKAGVSTRVGAALFAMRHDLLA